jgi:hypothetical protein
MAKITICRVDFYDVQNDTMHRSRRWFTREGAERVNGHVFEDTALEVDESALENGEQWTARGFDPRATKGFSRQAR